jgi:hypothetical protein
LLILTPGSTGIDDFDLIEAVASALKLSTAEEREGIEKALFPAMLCAAAATGSLARITGFSRAFHFPGFLISFFSSLSLPLLFFFIYISPSFYNSLFL